MNDRPFVVRSHDVKKDASYREWLLEIKSRYQNFQIKASVKVNSEQLLFNWQHGSSSCHAKIHAKRGDRWHTNKAEYP